MKYQNLEIVLIRFGGGYTREDANGESTEGNFFSHGPILLQTHNNTMPNLEAAFSRNFWSQLAPT
jgi:hypothetical protein